MDKKGRLVEFIVLLLSTEHDVIFHTMTTLLRKAKNETE